MSAPAGSSRLDRARLRAATTSTTAIAVMGVIIALTLVGLSYLSKTPCLAGPYSDLGESLSNTDSHRYLCYTDIQQLWVGRGIAEGLFPYVEGDWLPGEDGGQGDLMYGSLEYPVVTGLFMWVAKQPAHNVAEYMQWTVLLLAPFAALSAVLLARLSRWRVFVWAAAPALVFYSAYNWDLLPVAMCVGAVYAWARGRSLLAAALFGLGAATKIYPGFFLLPLTLERLFARDLKGAIKVAAVGAGTWLAVNLPFLVINFAGWEGTYRFQLGRSADITTNSIYFWGMPELPTADVDHLSLGLMLGSWLVAIGLGVFRMRRERRAAGADESGESNGSSGSGEFPWLQVGAAMLCGFLAFNKVYSPQYFIWVLPFLVLIRVRWGWWLAYWVIDALMFIGINRFYYDMGHDPRFTMAKQAAVLGVWGKTLILSLLVVVFTLAPLAFRRSTGSEPGRRAEGDAPDEADVPAQAG